VDKKKISIKINGTETTFKENGQARQRDEKTSEWGLPIRHTSSSRNVVSLAEHRKRKKSFLFRRGSAIQGEASVRKKRTLKGKVAVVIIGAMVLGTVFGYVLLGIMNNTTPVSKGQPSTQTTAPTAKQPKSVSATGNKVTLPGLSFSVLQAGVFTTESAASAFQRTWQEKGLPATVVHSDKYYVLAGVGKDIASLESLHDVYKGKNIDVFKKSYSIEESKLEVAGKENEDKLVKARDLYEQLLLAADRLLKGEGLSANETQKAQKLYDSIQGETIKEIQPFLGALTNAYGLLQVYEKEKNEVALMKAQQALLDTVSTYYKLIHMNG
jgi:stage II sporulation protein B